MNVDRLAGATLRWDRDVPLVGAIRDLCEVIDEKSNGFVGLMSENEEGILVTPRAGTHDIAFVAAKVPTSPRHRIRCVTLERLPMELRRLCRELGLDDHHPTHWCSLSPTTLIRTVAEFSRLYSRLAGLGQRRDERNGGEL